MRRYMRARRVELGLTVEEVADRISVSPESVYRWERGLVDPAAQNLLDLSELYATDPGRLMELAS